MFFTDKQRLTADSTAEPTLGKADLYECEIVEEDDKLACHLNDLTVDPTKANTRPCRACARRQRRRARASIWSAQGVLAGNENGDGESAEAGRIQPVRAARNSSGWEDDVHRGLSKEDKPEWEGEALADQAYLTARVSPNGRYLAFMSDGKPDRL